MYKSKYSNVLTVILIIAIIIILIVVGIVVANIVKSYNDDKNQKRVFEDFTSDSDTGNSNTDNQYDENYNYSDQNLVDLNITNDTQTESSSSGTRKVTYYPDTNFVVAGIIEIKAINLKYSILEKETTKALEKSVAIRYPTNPSLNTAGNVVIVGHNYRNGKFFSNLKKLSVGDEIKITDTSKKIVTYEIYDIFETTPEDTTYMTRDTGENIEISLSTCTDDGNARLIILAKAK